MLSGLTQIACLHSLCEWQLEQPERLRRFVHSDEDAVSWVCMLRTGLTQRVLPAGWDREGNTYWLFDDNRLWIERPASKPAKRKTVPKSKHSSAKKARSRAPPPPRIGGRRSSRLNRNVQDDGWETVPGHILPGEDDASSDSELTPPPPEEEKGHEAAPRAPFETICVTRAEWVAFGERFATSKHPDERQLHKYITKEVLPRVLEVLDAEDRKAALEMAMTNRKRSSRIAMRDSEREQREREEAEVREQRARAIAAAQAERDRAAQVAAETATRRSREDRLRERAERVLARERMMEERRMKSETPSLPTEETFSSERAHEAQPSSDSVARLPSPPAVHAFPLSATPVAASSAQVSPCVALPATLPAPHAPTAAVATHTAGVPHHAQAVEQMQHTHKPKVEIPENDIHMPTLDAPHRVPSTPPTPPRHMPNLLSPWQRTTSPRGSFPIRINTAPSPLARAVEPEDTPSYFALEGTDAPHPP